MQLKKTSTILPELDKENTTLISTINQTNTENGNTPISHENVDNLFEAAKSNDGKQLLFCKSCGCRIFEATPNTLMKHIQLKGSGNKNACLCGNCLLEITHKQPNSREEENEQSLSQSKTLDKNKINKKEDRHHCDKCRFTSKDLGQYKKHVLQHEEIKFICSYCGWVSYTKGEFQRHLVKHTGSFPYNCAYCEYGAVRNDYIVKHTKRVHGSGNEKEAAGISEKDEKINKCTTVTLNEEHIEHHLNSTLGTSFCEPEFETQTLTLNDEQIEHHSHSTASTFFCEPEFETWTPVTLCYVDDEPVQSPIINKHATGCDTGDLQVCQEVSVEVEMLCSESNLLQPGIPLTVVAPSQLVFPPNSFAQLMEVKMVNGIQKLILKLFQKKEELYECLNVNPEEFGTSSENRNELLTEDSLNQTELVTSYECAKKSNLNHDSSKSISNVVQNAFGFNLRNTDHTIEQLTLSVQEICGEGNMLGKNDVQLKHINSNVFLANPDLKEHEEHRNADLMLPHCFLTINQAQKETNCTEQSLNISTASFIYNYSDVRTAQCDLNDMAGGTNCSFLLQSEKLQLSPKIDTDEKCIHHPTDPQAFSVSSDSTLSSKALPSQACSNGLGLDTFHVLEDHPLLESYTPQNLDFISNGTEGPFISSVFSLSSGFENIPEGINWDDIPFFKIESTDLSYRNNSEMSHDVEDLKPPSTMLIDSCPACPTTTNQLYWKTAVSFTKNCSMDKVTKTENAGMVTEHIEKYENSSQTKMEATAETKCTNSLSDVRNHDGSCLSPVAIHATSSLKQDVLPDVFYKESSFSKTDLFQRDTFFLCKNENISEVMNKSEEGQPQPADFKQSNVDYVPKMQLANKNANVTHGLMSLSEDVETNCILKHEALIYETRNNSSHEEHNSPYCSTKGEGFFSVDRKPKVDKFKSGEAKNVHSTCPVFIPKGTILTVLHSTGTDSPKKSGDRSKHSNSVHGNETFLPRPVLFYNSVEQSQKRHTLSNKELFERADCMSNLKQEPNHKHVPQKNVKRKYVFVNQKSVQPISKKAKLKRTPSLKIKVKKASTKDCFHSKGKKIKSEQKTQNKKISVHTHHLRLIPVFNEQLIICPQQNQPVVVMNHPDIDSLEIVNIMEAIKKYKGSVRRVFLSERTVHCLNVKRRRKRLACENVETGSE